MIDLFKTWLPNIISYAQMVQDGTLRRAWEGEKSLTSTYYSGELEEQVFGDLDSDAMRWEMRSKLKEQPELVEAVELFLHALRRLIAWVDQHVDTQTWGSGQVVPASVKSIFISEEWREVEICSATLLAESRASQLTSTFKES